MMKLNRYATPLAAAALTFCGFTYSMGLQEVYQKALLQDAGIRASRAALLAGMERVPQAQSQLLPSVSASFSRNRNHLETTSPDIFGQSTKSKSSYSSHSNSLTLRQPILNVARRANLEQAQEAEREAIAMHDKSMQDLLARVTSAYADVLLADEQMRLVATMQQQDIVLLSAARKSFEAGAGTRTDIDEAQARLDMSRARELEAKQQRDYASRQLAVFIGEPVEQLHPLKVDRAQALALKLPALQTWLDQAKANSPDIKMLEARLAAAQKEVGKAQSGHTPTLDAVLQWSVTGNENVTRPSSRFSTTAMGLQLNVPLYQGGAVSSLVRQALAEQTRMQEMLEAGMRDLDLRVHKEFRGVTEGTLKVQALQQAEHSARQLLTSTKRSREGGFRTILDVLNAEQQLATVSRDLIQARFQALLSWARLNVMAGREPQLVLNEVSTAFAP
jgi:outer membrane protein, protease secretion system